MVRPVGLEPTTYWLKARCSALLSYGRLKLIKYALVDVAGNDPATHAL
jgi:hypothetical protein